MLSGGNISLNDLNRGSLESSGVASKINLFVSVQSQLNPFLSDPGEFSDYMETRLYQIRGGITYVKRRYQQYSYVYICGHDNYSIGSRLKIPRVEAKLRGGLSVEFTLLAGRV